MKKIILAGTVVCITALAFSQSVPDVKFLYNGRPLDIAKQLVSFLPKDTIQIVVESKESISVAEVRVQPFYAKYSVPDKGQQTGQKVTLITGALSKYNGFKNLKKYAVKIPVKAFTGGNLARLKINIIDCTNQKGDKLIRNNKVFEIFSPITSLVK